jgi:hypothetical protein
MPYDCTLSALNQERHQEEPLLWKKAWLFRRVAAKLGFQGGFNYRNRVQLASLSSTSSLPAFAMWNVEMICFRVIHTRQRRTSQPESSSHTYVGF